MIYLGIDPGTATTGFGLIKKLPRGSAPTTASKKVAIPEYAIIEFGVISTKKTDSDAHRLQILYEDLSAIIKKHQPTMIGIEKLFFTNNQRTAMTVSQARGVALLACTQANVPILEFTPLQVKNTLCGYGKADKKQVQTMVQRTFKLKNIPKPDDAADALAIALCAAVWKK
jgi:crossover junction endodeoxyribonuclease RuvC